MTKIILLFLAVSVCYAQNGIYIDEKFDDWNLSSSYYEDNIGDNLPEEIDIKSMWISNDKDYIYFRILLNKEIILVNNNNLTLLIDSDNNSNTGKKYDKFGAELEYVLGKRSGYLHLNKQYQVYSKDIGFVGAPTFSSDQFEFGIRRDIKFDDKYLFPNDLIKAKLIAFTSSSMDISSDYLPDTGAVEYRIKDLKRSFPESSILKPNSEDLRVMAYNVNRDGILETDKTTEFNHIFNLIKPDIIGLTEVYEHTSQEVADRIDFFIPLAEDAKWYNRKEGEYDIVLVSRYNIIKSATINSEVGHNASGAFLLNLRPEHNSEMLVIVSHPKCCGGTEEDLKRQNQFDAILSFIRNAKTNNGEFSIAINTPILIIGDMNLVGDSRQYETLISGDIKFNDVYGDDFIPDWDNTELEDAIPFVNNTGMTYTTNPGNFPPGRLDFIVYSGSVLNVTNSYIFDSSKLTEEELKEYSIDKNDTKVSDHLPVIVDFEILTSPSE